MLNFIYSLNLVACASNVIVYLGHQCCVFSGHTVEFSAQGPLSLD